ncbi:MAG: bifunctional (p)ppGpp synthetase/guanosine-3',5'-bis(diphosphate) 3'-pyrophosphohydrolase, partial [Clostridia bacterium]|nr:bifunctional (p)ppGpp synthetase/guanosine-3',5'-bis(diphosphate) 3'-pyrophosphohydrolase [Clostridia bacterium]
MLEKAIQIAARAHAGVTDKGGQPYILHPLRVMLMVENETERICAVLHYVVEDTGITLRQLGEEGFSKEILDALDA